MNKDPQIIITGLALLALSSANVAAAPASATATNFEGCHALLNMGLYNVTQSDSAKSAEYQAMATFCAYDYSSSNISSSQSAQIEASYGLFSGGAGGSASRQEIITKQSQVCTLGFNSSKYWEKASAYSKTVYQGSLDAWNRCQELANKGMEFEVQPSSTMQGVNVAITAPSGYQAIFYGVTQHGQGRSTCKIMANGKITPISLTKPFTFDAASKVTVDCNRIMKKNGNDLSADAQDMIFVTSAKNLVVPLAAIGSFSRVTADQVKESTLATINDQLEKMPAFAVSSWNGTGNNYPGNLQTFVFGNPSVNHGNGYRSDSGQFIAPMAGYYHFSYMISAVPDGSNSLNDVGFMVNGRYDESRNAVTANTSPVSQWLVWSNDATYYLKQGDSVTVMRPCCSDSQPLSWRGNFMGHYLHR